MDKTRAVSADGLVIVELMPGPLEAWWNWVVWISGNPHQHIYPDTGQRAEQVLAQWEWEGRDG